MKLKDYICGGTNFTYSLGYISLPVVIETLPETLPVNGVVLHRKSNFHVSLLCVKALVAAHGVGIEQRLLDVFCTFVNEHSILFVNYLDEFRFAEDGERKTLIVRCRISGLEEFFSCLESTLGIAVPSQPTHVTLYTLQPDVGIGLNSPESMESKSIRVQVPTEIRKSVGVD